MRVQVSPSRLLATERIPAVDVARWVALVGMMAVHLFPHRRVVDPEPWWHEIFSGRASALFALVAGVSLALQSRTNSGEGHGLRPGSRRAVAARALLIAVLGLSLGMLKSGVAVVLVPYALMFGAVIPFLGWSVRGLTVLSAAWLLVSPWLGLGLRRLASAGPGNVPSWLTLVDDPGSFLVEQLLTGYYPVLQWVSFVLVGLTVGVMLGDQRVGGGTHRRLSLRLVVAGAVMAFGSVGVSQVLLGPLGGRAHLERACQGLFSAGGRFMTPEGLFYGTTPSNSWWWLAVSQPHSGSAVSVVHVTGCALLALGTCLLMVHSPAKTYHPKRGVWWLPLAATGSMTLTWYTVHVVVMKVLKGTTYSPTSAWVWQILAFIVLSTAWQFTGWRGPLESLTHRVSVIARTCGSRTKDSVTRPGSAPAPP